MEVVEGVCVCFKGVREVQRCRGEVGKSVCVGMCVCVCVGGMWICVCVCVWEVCGCVCVLYKYHSTSCATKCSCLVS